MLKTILNRQIELAKQLNEALNFINYYEGLGKEIKDSNPHLNWIFLLSRDFCIITFEKLLGHSDYSFNSISKQVKETFLPEQVLTFQKQLSQANKLYRLEKIETLRNEHVAHLDQKRLSHTTNWRNIDMMFKRTQEVLSELHKLLIDSNFRLSDPVHSERLIHHTETYSRARSLYFESKKEYKSSVSIDQLKSIFFRQEPTEGF